MLHIIYNLLFTVYIILLLLLQLKSLLAEGGVTKEMVKEMEKSMGLDFGMFVKMLNNPAAKANAKGLGSDVNEMIELFKELNKIKNS